MCNERDLASSGIPVLQPFKFPTDLSIGEDALFTCVVKRGKPPYAFRWLKNGQELLGHDRILLNVMSQRLATMAIPRIVAEDNANYSCVVSNDAGTDAITASLVITGEIRFFVVSYHQPVQRSVWWTWRSLSNMHLNLQNRNIRCALFHEYVI